MGRAETRRARRKLERREAILDAAAHVFGEKGASATTMDDIAEAADVSKGTLYLYFPSKDDLFLALTHRPLDVVLAEFEVLFATDSLDGLSLIRKLVAAHQEVLHLHATQMRIAFASMCAGFEVDPGTPSLHDYNQRVRQLRTYYLDAIERGVHDGSLRPDLDPGEVSMALWAGMFGASFIRMNADRFKGRLEEVGAEPPLEHVHQAVEKLLLAAIAAPSPEETTP